MRYSIVPTNPIRSKWPESDLVKSLHGLGITRTRTILSDTVRFAEYQGYDHLSDGGSEANMLYEKRQESIKPAIIRRRK